MKKADVPEATKTLFEGGQHSITTVEGDLILVVHSGFMPAVIRTGQRIKYWFRRTVLRQAEYLTAYCIYNHAMIVVQGGPEARVSQMEAKGGTIVDLLEYVDKKYVVVSTVNATAEQRAASAAFGLWSEGIEYGWLSIFGAVLDVLIPLVEISLGSGQRMICSTASSLAQRCVGLIPDYADPSVLPADLARYFDVQI